MPTLNRTIRIILPAYNEEESLPPLLARIDAFVQSSGLSTTVLVVNDGSTDNTLEIAQKAVVGFPLAVADVQPNQGLANALFTGLSQAAAQAQPDDVLVVMDADDSQNPQLIALMFQQILLGSDVVIASRYQPGARIKGLTLFRKIMSLGAGFIFRMLVGLPGVRDYTCGFRAYRAGLIQQALAHYGNKFIEQKGFGCMIEVLLKLKPFDPILHEVPMILRYDQKQGASKMKVWRTIRQTLALLLQYKLQGNRASKPTTV